MRLFLDANVLFSAAYRETGSVRILFSLAEARGHELVASAYAIEEARRNLADKHPGRLGDFERLLDSLRVCPEAPHEAVAWAAARKLPPKDAPILAAAVRAGADVLVTGDRTHFGALFGKTLRGTEVLLPVDAIERLIAAG